MSDSQSVAQRLYKKYEYLAITYAKKVYNYEFIGMEYDDVVQEFRLKIWYSIVKFGERWKEYRASGKFKPVPLQFFLRGNLNRLIIDMTKKINGFYIDKNGEKQERVKGFLSVQEIGFDFGVESDPMTLINFKEKRLFISGIDLLDGLEDKEKDAFILFLKGYSFKNIKALTKNVQDPVGRIKTHIAKLEGVRDQMGTNGQVFKVFSFSEEDNV